MEIKNNSSLDSVLVTSVESENPEKSVPADAAAPKVGQIQYLIDWVCNYLDLLAAEQNYEELKYQAEGSRKDTDKQDKRKPRLTNCRFQDFSSESFGKSIIRFSTRKACDGFCKGDPVAVQEERGGSALRGIIYMVTENSVQVFLNKTCNYLDEDSLYTIIKLADNTTHFRMRLAIQKLAQLNQLQHPLVSLMFGEGKVTRKQLKPADIKFFNEHLTDDQKEAVAFALSVNELAIIHGPPGTGKTTVLVECALHMVKMGNKVLLCAPTNVAVDNILSSLVCHSHVKVVRLGHPARTGLHNVLLDTMLSSSEELPKLRKELQQLEVKFARAGRADGDTLQNIRRYSSYLLECEQLVTRDILRDCDVVACTLLSASDTSVLKYLGEEFFDAVIIDENSQAMEAASWVALPWAKKAILAGDHLQLPPTVHSPSPCELELSLMERAIAKLQDECVRVLRTQHRMNTHIMHWVSSQMYEGKLSAHPSVADHLLCHLEDVELTEDTETPLLLVDTAGCRLTEEDVLSSRQNLGEARIVKEVVERLLAAGVSEDVIGIITPYSQQVQLIKQLLEEHAGLEVRSVDGYQGQEKEAIVLSMVRSNLDGDLGFTTDRRRLNVAVSRARRLLCVVADTRTLATCELYQSLFTHIRQRGVVHSAHQYDCVIPCGQSSGNKKNKGKKSSSTVGNKDSGSDAEVDKCLNMLQEFVEDKSRSVHRFSCKLTSYARMRLHSESEKLGLKHYSEGTGDERCLVVEKIVIRAADGLLDDNLAHSSSDDNDDKNSDTDEVHEPSKKELLISELGSFDSCNENAPCEKSSMQNGLGDPCNVCVGDSVKPQCETMENGKIELEAVSSNVPASKEIDKDTPKPTKRHRGRKKADDAPKSIAGKGRGGKGVKETDEAVLHSFQLDNKTCADDGCGKSTELFGQLCQHCRRMYCLSHCIPEVHGCAAAAHTHARSTFLRPPPKPVDPIKHGFTERKLKAKLDDMAQKRKPKKK